jgi:hypothetical protein
LPVIPVIAYTLQSFDTKFLSNRNFTD